MKSAGTKPRLVVVDGHTLNPGDLSWADLEMMADCIIHPRTPPEAMMERLDGAEFVLSNKAPIGKELLSRCRKLRYIGVTATGFNIVDVAAARELRVAVTNVPAYGTHSVAQHTFALLLELTQRVGSHAELVRQGEWSRCPDFSFWRHPLVELAGKTIGIVGMGRIGRAVSELARAFGMRVVVNRSERREAGGEGFEEMELDALLSTSDVVSLHCPLVPETERFMTRERLQRMKRGSFLLNTSRGPLVDELALRDLLEDGHLAGAGLDVLSLEPPPEDHPLLSAPNCLITPHLAWATREARMRLMREAVDNVRSFLEGGRRNRVD